MGREQTLLSRDRPASHSQHPAVLLCCACQCCRVSGQAERETLRGHSETSPHSNLTRTAGQFSPLPQNPVRVSLIFPPRTSPSTEFLSSQCSCVDYKITRHFRSVFTSCYLFYLIKLLNKIIRDITLWVVFFQLNIITSTIQWHSAIMLEVITLLQRHLFENNVKKKRS